MVNGNGWGHIEYAYFGVILAGRSVPGLFSMLRYATKAEKFGCVGSPHDRLRGPSGMPRPEHVALGSRELVYVGNFVGENK